MITHQSFDASVMADSRYTHSDYECINPRWVTLLSRMSRKIDVWVIHSGQDCELRG